MCQITPKAPEKDIISIFQSLIKDEKDIVRLNIVESVSELFKIESLENFSCDQHSMKFLKILSEDNYWRVKFIVCENLPYVILFCIYFF